MKLNLKTCERVCNECPFRKDSVPGWLGGFSVDDTLDAQQFEQLFSCHKTRVDDPEENQRKVESGEIPICRGFLISAKLSCKIFGQHPITGKALYKLQDGLVISDDEKSLILTIWKFREYHEQYKTD